MSAPSQILCMAEALYDYAATEDDEHSLTKGELLQVVDKQEDGWWSVLKTTGTSAGKTGLIPSNYVYVKVNASDAKELTPSSYLPPGWESSIDRDSGERYYYNKATGQVQWSAPAAEGEAGKLPRATGAPGTKGPGAAGRAGGVKMTSSDLADFKRLREEADNKLAALRKVLSYQENLHLLESNTKNGQGQGQGQGQGLDDDDQQSPAAGGGSGSVSQLPLPSKPVGAKSQPAQASPRTRGYGKSGARPTDRDRDAWTRDKDKSNQAAGAAAGGAGLRLDPVSLRAIARIVDDKLDRRDDMLLGKMKAIVETASPTGSPLKQLSPEPVSYPIDGGNNATGLGLMSTPGAGIHLTKYQSHSPSPQTLAMQAPFDRQREHAAKGKGKGKGAVAGAGALALAGLGLGSDEKKPWVDTHSPPGLAAAAGGGGGGGDRHVKQARAPFRVSRYDVSNHKAAASEGILYPQCRSAVYPPSIVDDGTGVTADGLVDTSQPSTALVLDHVYAYSGDSSRHSASIRGKNVMFLDNTRIIYPAAALVVIMDMATQTQSFFAGHSEDVTCITVHPDRTIAASGQLGKDGRVLIWDSSTIEPGAKEHSAAVDMHMMGGTRGVSGLNFSGDGRFLVALGLDEGHSMVVFDWATATIIASVKAGSVGVSQMGFNPFLFTAVDRQDELKMPMTPREHKEKSESCCYTLVSCGGRQIKFWTLRRTLEKEDADNSGQPLSFDIGGFKGRKINFPKKKSGFSASYTLEGNTAVFPKTASDVPDILCFVCVNDGEGGAPGTASAPRSRIFTGTSTGAVYIWQQLEEPRNKNSLTHYSWQPKGRLLSVVSDVHESPIMDLDYTGAYWFSTDPEENTNERLITSSADGMTNVWKMDRRTGAEASGVPFEHMSTVNIGYSETHVGSPRCVSWDLDGSSAVVGTTANALLRLSGEGMYSFNPSSLDSNSAEHALQAHVYISTVVRGHHSKILRVTAHPTEPIFATISTDKTVRLWNARQKTQIALTRLADRASAVEFTPDGTALAIGNESGELLIVKYAVLDRHGSFGNGSGGGSSSSSKFHGVGLGHGHGSGSEEDLSLSAVVQGPGSVLEKQWQVVLRRHVAAKTMRATPSASAAAAAGAGMGGAESSQVSHSTAALLAKKKSEVMEMRFSPDGEVLAIGCRDNLIHLLSISSGYRRAAVCRGHSSYIRNMDFSVDGRVLRSTDAVRELLYWEVATGKQIANASHTRDLEWHTGKCCLGWHVQGVFNGAAGVPVDADVNAVSRSSNGKLILVGTSSGVGVGGSSSSSGGSSSSSSSSAVKLFRYPCISKAVPALHGGHTSPVLDVVFLAGDEEAVTIGGSDATIFSWTLR